MLLHDCFADEIAVDFPSVGTVVDRMRDTFFGERDDHVLRADLVLSGRQASGGLVVPIELDVPGTCESCGGRGESWTDRCDGCHGTGKAMFQRRLRVSVPRGVADGARFRFRLASPHAPPVLVEVCVLLDRVIG